MSQPKFVLSKTELSRGAAAWLEGQPGEIDRAWATKELRKGLRAWADHLIRDGKLTLPKGSAPVLITQHRPFAGFVLLAMCYVYPPRRRRLLFGQKVEYGLMLMLPGEYEEMAAAVGAQPVQGVNNATSA